MKQYLLFLSVYLSLSRARSPSGNIILLPATGISVSSYENWPNYAIVSKLQCSLFSARAHTQTYSFLGFDESFCHYLFNMCREFITRITFKIPPTLNCYTCNGVQCNADEHQIKSNNLNISVCSQLRGRQKYRMLYDNSMGELERRKKRAQQWWNRRKCIDFVYRTEKRHTKTTTTPISVVGFLSTIFLHSRINLS